jgi:phosphoglycolate phosphatase
VSATAAVLFDLDGTLTDSRPGIVRCMRFALDGLGRPCPSDDVLASFIGPPLRGTFGALLDTASPALIEEAMRLYRVRFADTGLFENEVYAGVPAMLTRARRLGPAFVATSKPAVYAERIVRHFGLDPHFARVYGSELSGRFEDKTELLAHVLAAEGIAARRAVMVGDRAADIIAARLNGLASIGALWGYGTERELAEAGADALCAAPGELVACLERTVRGG